MSTKAVIEITRWNPTTQIGWAVTTTQTHGSDEYILTARNFKTAQALAQVKVGRRFTADLTVSPYKVPMAINIEERNE